MTVLIGGHSVDWLAEYIVPPEAREAARAKRESLTALIPLAERDLKESTPGTPGWRRARAIVRALRSELPPAREWLPMPYYRSGQCDAAQCALRRIGGTSPARKILGVRTHTVHLVSVPIWTLLAIAAIPTAALWWRNRPFPNGRCQRCGYDLTGNVSGRCPECGEAI